MATRSLRKGVELLTEALGEGSTVQKHAWYQIKLRMWLRRGDPVRWERPWGSLAESSRLEDDGATLITDVRIDRVFLIGGLFYGIQGMRIGGMRVLRLAPRLAYGSKGVTNVIPPDAVLTAELSVIAERPQK